MLNETAVIMASREDSGRVSLYVGSFEKMSSGGGGGGMWMGGGGGAPMMYVPSGGFYRDTWTKSARFKMLLDAGTLEHISGDMPATINEKIESYTEGALIPQEGENLFRNNGNYIYGYYDRNEHKIILVKF